MHGGLRLTAIGLAAGLALAVAATQLIRTLLFDVQPLEAWCTAPRHFSSSRLRARLSAAVDASVTNRSATRPASE
jgi:hypothetical protein